MQAIARALEIAPKTGNHLAIKTSSGYAFKSIQENITRWERSEWCTGAGKPVQDQALLRYVEALLRSRSGTAAVEFVPARGNHGRACARGLARMGVKLPLPVDRDWDACRLALEADGLPPRTQGKNEDSEA
ncbi:hypothetical protein OE88DRAFT_1656719 [Heliocybe sulcata]|uniref:RNase H type-1 domain-containing protein n=1 Tax=Heliocybe sulcata TaxID=5364 RepID=A0A5C3N6Y7_9AGAM|nr:hypothetical protein OE88DRAFT_1656719 [Heliocybe sulcata]